MMIVTEVHIHPITPQRGLVAFAHVIVNDSLLLGSIGIHEKSGGGYRITYPQKGQSYVFHPIRQPLGKTIEAAIIHEAKKVLGKPNVGYRCDDAGSR